MICFAAITPHTPLLLPSIGKEHRNKLAKSLESVEKIKKGLLDAKPDVILIISPHSPVAEDAFSTNISTKYVTDLSNFGDYSLQYSYKPDYDILSAIQEFLGDEYPLKQYHQHTLDYGASVPLALLFSQISNKKIVPISPSGLHVETHQKFGSDLGKLLHSLEKRVAIIASADLARLDDSIVIDPKKDPVTGKDFNDIILHSLVSQNFHLLSQKHFEALDQKQLKLLKPLVLFLNMLNPVKVDYEELSYETPFGVGYVTSRIHIL